MEVALYVVGGLVAGSVITWVVTKSILNARYQGLLLRKAVDLNEIKNQNSVLQANIEAQNKSLEEVRKVMLDTFKSAASDALIQNNEQFLTLAKTQLEAKVKDSEGNLDQRKIAIEEMLKPVKEAIESYKKRIEELEKGSEKTFGRVTEMLSNIQSTHASLQKETGG
jgi:DNA recombination protein RmuC